MASSRGWMKWTVAESATRTSSAVLQKVVGASSATSVGALWASFVIGIVQVVVGSHRVITSGVGFRDQKRNTLGALLFGILAFIATVLGFITFMYPHADLGSRVFVITLAIIPGALIDRVFFGKPLSGRQWIGIFVGLLAGYSVLGSPQIILGTWIWFAIANSLVGAINQGITQAIKDIDPFRKNFWGGAVAVIGSCLLIPFFGNWSDVFSSPTFVKVTTASLAIGGIVVLMWMFNVWAYRDGASIAIKKLVLNGLYLTTSMIAGIVLFDDSATWGKFIGVVLFGVAFVLMDNSTWQYFSVRMQFRRS